MAYETPGVYVEEISGGPRPIAASATTDTAFVGVLALPAGFQVGNTGDFRSLIPVTSSSEAQASWARELAFRSTVPALMAPGKVQAAGADVDEAALAKALGALDKKKNEVFRAAGTDYADTKSLWKDLASQDGKITAERAGDGGVAASVELEVTPAREIAPSLDSLVADTLGKQWTATVEPAGDRVKVLFQNGSGAFDVFMPSTLMVSSSQGYVLAAPSLKAKVLSLIGSEAQAAGVGASSQFEGKETQLEKSVLASVQEALLGHVSPLNTLDSFIEWRDNMADELYVEFASAFAGASKSAVRAAWKSSKASKLRSAWATWVRTNPGMVRLEVSIRGFFTNGGTTAYPSLYLSAAGASPMSKPEFLGHAYDDFSRVAMVAAPGLSRDWQDAILTYCGPKGRKDLFAVLDTPRYFLTQPGDALGKQRVGSKRWSDNLQPGDDPNFEVQSLEAIGSPEMAELRYRKLDDTLLSTVTPRDDVGHGACYAPWVICDNPNSSGIHDRYLIAPPAGFVAGLIGATDEKAGGGVHKAPANEQLAGVVGLTALISDKDQGPLNMRSINIIRPRPNAGIRVWGARTIASDPLWKYVNVRRLFLMVERSVRDAVEWAVFLPNTDRTRGDLRSTIAAFLFSLWREGMLDGASPAEAYNVACDRSNNPDVDVRNGLLTVDVEMRPPFPAEFIRLRFRQSPMQIDA
jgi:hypothetical protein